MIPNRNLADLPLASPGTPCDERTFLYLLTAERSCARRTNQGLWLLLASVEPVSGKPEPIANATGARLLAELRTSVRETDITGWYRQDRIAGAVLAACADAPRSDAAYARRRVYEALRRKLPSALNRTLRVRLVRLRWPARRGS